MGLMRAVLTDELEELGQMNREVKLRCELILELCVDLSAPAKLM